MSGRTKMKQATTNMGEKFDEKFTCGHFYISCTKKNVNELKNKHNVATNDVI